MAGMILTQNGRNLLAKALTGKTLHFTRAATGDGNLGNKDPYTLTDLIHFKQTLAIQSITTSQTGTCEVVTEMTNKGLAAGYFVREYGLFANDPDTGRELLYSYANKGDNCSYLEGDNGTDLINYALSLMTVIDQAPNITATINTANSYVTITRLDNRIASLYAEGVTPLGFWTFAPSGDNRLRPLELDAVKRIILGTSDIAALNSRVERLEDNLAQVLLSQEMQELYPDYTHYIIEDFKNINQLDEFSCDVKSIIAGDDSLDCEPIDGMLPGSWYTITDGINSELVQIESINVENGIQRVILTEPVKNTYYLEYCQMFRTSAKINSQTAVGPHARLALSWMPNFIWKGQSASASYKTNLNISTGNLNTFSISGNITLNSDGFITLR